MSRSSHHGATGPARTRRWALALALAAAWAAVVPYLGRAIGAEVDVASAVEVVDHVVPGGVVLAASLLLAGGRGADPAPPGELRWSVAAGATWLAGFWVAATHAPLLVEATGGVTPWDAALLHLSAAAPVLAAGTAMLVLPLVRRPGPDATDRRPGDV